MTVNKSIFQNLWSGNTQKLYTSFSALADKPVSVTSIYTGWHEQGITPNPNLFWYHPWNFIPFTFHSNNSLSLYFGCMYHRTEVSAPPWPTRTTSSSIMSQLHSLLLSISPLHVWVALNRHCLQREEHATPFPSKVDSVSQACNALQPRRTHIPWFEDQSFWLRNFTLEGGGTVELDTFSMSRLINFYDHHWPPVYVSEEPLFDSLVLALNMFCDTLPTRLADNCEVFPNRLLQIILNNCHSAKSLQTLLPP